MRKALSAGIALLIACSVFAQDAKFKALEAEADTLLDRQDFDGAIKIYSKIIKSSKLKDDAAYGSVYKRAVSYYSIGDFESALKDLDVFIPKFPNVPQARLLRALVYKGLGDSEKQMKDLNDALDSQPGNPALLKWRCTLYLDQGEFQLAKKDALNAKAIEDDAEVEMYLGFANYNLGQFDSAIYCLKKAMEFDATYLPAYLYAGSFCLEEEKYEMALEYLDLALRLDPQNPNAIFYKGIALVELEKADEGCRCLRKAFYSGLDDAGDYLKEYCFGIEN